MPTHDQPDPSTQAPGDRFPEIPDTRGHGPMTGSIRELVDYWLDLYRSTMLHKIAGLTPEQACTPASPPSQMSLLGIIRHMTEVEAYWVREIFLGGDLPDIHSSRENPDGDLIGASPDTAFADVALYEAEVAAVRDIVAKHPDLGELAQGTRGGEPVNLGWILTHLIEEYARHAGHMDIIREQLDGTTGY